MDKPNRTLVVGDIHGAEKALLQVLERCVPITYHNLGMK